MKEYWIVKDRKSGEYCSEREWLGRDKAVKFARRHAYAAAGLSEPRDAVVVHVTVKPKRPEPVGWINQYETSPKLGLHLFPSYDEAKRIGWPDGEPFPVFRVRRWETP